MNLPIQLKAGYRPQSGYELAETHCFYCHQPFDNHKDDCVCVTRTVVLEMTIRYIAEVPRNWNIEMINFHRGESSYCLANDIEQLYTESEKEKGICNICQRASVKYLAEATEQDHDNLAWMGSREH